MCLPLSEKKEGYVVHDRIEFSIFSKLGNTFLSIFMHFGRSFIIILVLPENHYSMAPGNSFAKNISITL